MFQLSARMPKSIPFRRGKTMINVTVCEEGEEPDEFWDGGYQTNMLLSNVVNIMGIGGLVVTGLRKCCFHVRSRTATLHACQHQNSLLNENAILTNHNVIFYRVCDIFSELLTQLRLRDWFDIPQFVALHISPANIEVRTKHALVFSMARSRLSSISASKRHLCLYMCNNNSVELQPSDSNAGIATSVLSTQPYQHLQLEAGISILYPANSVPRNWNQSIQM